MYGQGYDPNFYGFRQQQQGLIRVNGIDGARAYQMAPNSMAALFDNNDDILYIKTTDGAGFPTVRRFRFTEIIDAPATGNFVSREEMEQYVKQLIQQQPAAAEPAADASGKRATNGHDKSSSI